MLERDSVVHGDVEERLSQAVLLEGQFAVLELDGLLGPVAQYEGHFRHSFLIPDS
jgi:hypothetical protein